MEGYSIFSSSTNSSSSSPSTNFPFSLSTSTSLDHLDHLDHHHQSNQDHDYGGNNDRSEPLINGLMMMGEHQEIHHPPMMMMMMNNYHGHDHHVIATPNDMNDHDNNNNNNNNDDQNKKIIVGVNNDNSSDKLVKKKSLEKKVKKHRYAFQTRSQVDILDDGYRWRKYGQKAVKNNKFPRSYYRCTYQGCNVKKQVQRLSNDEGVVVTTYEGIHSHSIERSTDNFEHILSQMQIYTSVV